MLLDQFVERYIFHPGETRKLCYGKRIYQGQDDEEKEFEEWHTAMQYIEMIQLISQGRRRSSNNLE